MVEPHHVGAVGDGRDERRQDPGRGVVDVLSAVDRLGARGGRLRVAGAVSIAERALLARRREAPSGTSSSRRRGCRCGPARRRGSPTRRWRSPPRDVVPARVRRAARRGGARRRASVADSSPVATAVTRSTSSCASSTTSSRCSGSTVASVDGIDGQQRVIGDDHIGVPSLVAGLFCKAVRPKRAAGHTDALPGRYADTCDHDRSGTPGITSSRSPVSVTTTMRESLDVAAERAGSHRRKQFVLRSVLRFGRCCRYGSC